jgi:hypothetical protein
MARVRSPNYPALSLPDAVARVRDVHKQQQTTPEPRDVVVRHMGYNSSNGRALKALSALLKYGFLEEVPNEGLKVSDRAVSILYPDPSDPSAKAKALVAASREPALFADIMDRWKGARPSPESLEAFLVRKGFNLNSIEQVARAFYATLDLVGEQGSAYDSPEAEEAEEEEQEMEPELNPSGKPTPPAPKGGRQWIDVALNSTKPIFDFETVAIHTKIDNQEDLAELIERLEKIKGMLPNKTQH